MKCYVHFCKMFILEVNKWSIFIGIEISTMFPLYIHGFIFFGQNLLHVFAKNLLLLNCIEVNMQNIYYLNQAVVQD